MRENIPITTPTAGPDSHKLRWPDRLGLAIAGAVGMLALFTGLMMMISLSSAYRTADIFYQQPVASFAAWLSALPAPVGVAGRADSQATAIADRLLLLPVSPRRAILSAMMDNGFWSGLTRSEEDRRRFIVKVSELLFPVVVRPGANGSRPPGFHHAVLPGSGPCPVAGAAQRRHVAGGGQAADAAGWL